MKEELHIEAWDMKDFSVQASIAPELFGDECDVIEVKRGDTPVLAVVPWEMFMEMLRTLTLDKQREQL